MIRYTCQSCGKSLRANDGIIGRKAQCTRCGTIAKIPATSTRPSSQKKNPGNIEPFRDSTDSDALPDSHDDVVIDKQSSTNLSVGLPKQVADFKRRSDDVDQPVEPDDDFEPVFKRLERKNKFLSPMTLACAAGLLAVSASIYWYLYFGQSKNEKIATAFEQTTEAIQYQAALSDLRKSQRILSLMADGYLIAKNRPESELADLNEFVKSLDQFTKENIAIDEANDLFDAGHLDTAADLIEKESAIIADLQAEIRKRTLDLQAKTYQ